MHVIFSLIRHLNTIFTPMKVLKTEQEIMELDHSGFTSQYPTVFAGNLGNGKYILQVVIVTLRGLVTSS